jgi:predicted dehydrogenase
MEALAGLQAAGRLGRVAHYYFRLFAGPPERYREWGVEWMLDPARAGAGPLFNFGPHGVDLFLTLAAEPIVEVSAWTSHALHHEKIEDLASLRLRTEAGALGVVEVGYVLPGAYERYFSLTTDALHVGGSLETGTILRRGGDSLPYAGGGSDDAYATYVADVLARYAAGEPARIDLGDAVAALRVLNTAQESAATGKPVEVE